MRTLLIKGLVLDAVSAVETRHRYPFALQEREQPNLYTRSQSNTLDARQMLFSYDDQRSRDAAATHCLIPKASHRSRAQPFAKFGSESMQETHASAGACSYLRTLRWCEGSA
ncbi:hypothetical protein P3342_012854 [Pyrenophora teres f. teres]|nr:hypothetical protein P3342_012854 [Pyrenophora teres f. teres]